MISRATTSLFSVAFIVLEPSYCSFARRSSAEASVSHLPYPVVAEEIPGFLFGLLRGLFFFRRHSRLFLVFPVASVFFRHNVLLRNSDG